MATRKVTRKVGKGGNNDWWNNLFTPRRGYGASSVAAAAGSGPPPIDEGEEGPAPLGVPRGYTAARERDMRGMSPTAVENWPSHKVVEPRYFKGDEWLPAGESPDTVAALQRDLFNAGYLSGSFSLGRWDEASREAYKSLLSEANAAGVDRTTQLGLAMQSATVPGAGGSGGGGGGRQVVGWDENGQPIWESYVAPPLEIRKTNIDDLRQVFRRSVIETLGQGWSQAQIDSLASAYQAEEERVQRQAYDQQVALERADFEGTRSPGGGEVIEQVDIASPEAFAENEMIRRDPEGYKAGQLVQNAIPAFMAAMSAWGS